MKTALAFVFSVILLTVSSFAQDKPGSAAAPSRTTAAPKNVEVKEAEKLLKENKGIVVLDVRTPREFAESRIAGAKNINFNDSNFQKQLAALDKTQTYLVHCAVGGRSAKARDLMQKLQFQSIYHLEGGLKAWEKAGQPVER